MTPSREQRRELRRSIMDDRRAVRDIDDKRHNLWGPASNPRVQSARSRWAELPYHPEYLRFSILCAVLALAGFGAFAIRPFALGYPLGALPLLLGAVAFAGGVELARYFGEPVVPADVNAMEFRRRLLRRRLRAGGPGLLALVAALGLLASTYGGAGFALGEGLWALGLAAGSGAYAVASRVRYCPHCRYFVTFRRYEGRWACSTCGRSLEGSPPSPVDTDTAQSGERPL